MAVRRGSVGIPRQINHKRWCKNGDIPDASFLRELVYGQNHIMSARRKVIFRHPIHTFHGNGGLSGGFSAAAGTTNLWRALFHSGHGCTRLRFLIGFAATTNASATDPRIDIDVTEFGSPGSTLTTTLRAGASLGGTENGPNRILWRKPVSETLVDNQQYEILIKAIDYATPLGLCVIEEAQTSLNNDYFHAIEPGIDTPIYDSIRERTLQGLSEIWRHNGSHLLNWTFVGTSLAPWTPPTYSSTTWTNVVDGSTSVSSSTPGYYLGDSGGYRLENWCRLSDDTSLNVVFGAYASMSAGSTGEVRLQNGGGTVCSLTGITTTPQWHTTTTTINGTDTLDKVDLQARTSNGANTLTLHAVSLYTYLA
jgi:hypothetical protein